MTVTVYTKEHCAQCRHTKNLLDKKKVKYETVDVTNNPEAVDYLESKGFTGLPVVEAGEESWQGFRPGRIEELG